MKLASLSERQLARGETQKAYETARRAVDRKPSSASARRAMTAAAARIIADDQRKVIAMARSDTLEAARHSLDLRDFLAELGRYQIAPPRDSSLVSQVNRIRDAGAGIAYHLGEENLAARHPKAAYGDFVAAAAIVAGFRDVQSRIEQARDAATVRVAFLPFTNDTDVPGLAKPVADETFAQLAARVREPAFRFTRLVDHDEVYASMTVKELESVGRDEALRIARGVEADRLVTGRLHGLRASSAFRSFDRPIYRKIVERDSTGRERVRYVETRFDGVSRERRVTVHCDFEVIDARSGEPLASRRESFEANARVAWTDFRAEGDCGMYSLTTPDLRRDDPEHAREVEASWRECFGSWKLPELLEAVRQDRRRAAYQPGDRGEFRRPSQERPVLLGELPSEDEMASLALERSWEIVLAALQELDSKE